MKLGRKTLVGKALLDGQSLIFRGEQALEFRFERIREVTAEEGTLVIATDEQEARFDLGPQLAERWMRLIKEPKGLFEKLELGSESRVALVEVADPLFATALRERVSSVVDGRVPQGTAIIFLGAETREALRKIPLLRARLVDTGALWIIRPKGNKTVTEADVSNATREAGLIEAKVVAFSRTHTAHKCVVPVEMRGQARRRPPILSIPPSQGPSRLKPSHPQPLSGSRLPASDSSKSPAEEKKRR
ncbi:MAG: hypothetical protein M3O50_04185 [Myxococcota bacterium]|nr:hypothetical protein [Myxococcota bacterium]